MLFLSRLLAFFVIITCVLFCRPCEAKIIEGQAIIETDRGLAKSELEDIALNFAKREALESAAVYINSLTNTYRGAVTRDEVASFVSGVTKLVPGTIKKTYKESNNEKLLYMRAQFVIDEKRVESNIERYKNDKSTINKFKEEIANNNFILTKYEYLLYRKSNEKESPIDNSLTEKDKKYITNKLNSGSADDLNDIIVLSVDYYNSGKYKETVAVYNMLIPVSLSLYSKNMINGAVLSDLYLWRAKAFKALEMQNECDNDINEALKYNANNIVARNFETGFGSKHADTDNELQEINNLITLDPVIGYHNLACYRMKNGDFIAAHNAMDESISYESQRNDAEHLNRMATAYTLKGAIYEKEFKLKDAELWYSKAIETCPTLRKAYMQRGILREKLAKFEEGMEDFTKAIELQTDVRYENIIKFKADAYFNRAMMYMHLEKWDECLRDINASIELDPDNGRAYVFKKTAEENLKRGNKITSIDEEKDREFYAQHWVEKGDSLYHKKDYFSAIDAYTKAIEINPNNDEAWNNLGVISSTFKEYQTAIEFYNEAIKIKPKDDVVWTNLANAYRDSKSYDNAFKAYNKALELNPKNPKTWRNLGITHFTLKDYKKAIECCNKAVEINPKYDLAWDTLGNIYDELKNHKKASECYAKANKMKEVSK